MFAMRETTFRAVAAAAVALGLLALPARLPAQEAASVSPRIAVIDVGRILEESEAGRAMEAKLKRLKDEKDVEGTKIQEQAQGLQTQITEGRLSLSEERLVELQEQLTEKVQELRRFEEDANRFLLKEQQKELQAIEKRVMPVIGQVGQEFGYTVIFNKFQSGLVYAADEIDITDLVLERFNAAAGS